MIKLICPSTIVNATLEILRAAGDEGREQVVLWLSHRGEAITSRVIVEAFRPRQETEQDYFYIPADAMTELMRHLRGRGLSLSAQVHSHPRFAFHSRADDHWAIARHEGALSIVVPRFAFGVTPSNFAKQIATYRLSPNDKWINVRTADLGRFLELS